MHKARQGTDQAANRGETTSEDDGRRVCHFGIQCQARGLATYRISYLLCDVVTHSIVL